MKEPKTIKSKSWNIVILLLLVSGVNFLYMPAFRIQGDSAVIEFVSVRLVKFGTLSVPGEIASNYGEMGQFFFRNILKDKWYSKYGIANTFIMVIPLYLEKLFTGGLQYHSECRILFLNLFNILLTTFLFYYVYQISACYTKRTWIKIAFSLSVFYCTYLSYYTRSQSSELYQTLFFTGFFYHSLVFLRYTESSRLRFLKFQLNPHLMLSLVFLGLCCLVKVVYILMLPGFVFIMLNHLIKRRYDEKVRGISSNSILDISISLLFVIFLIILITFVNYYKFGSIFEAGYGQWKNEFKISIGNIMPNFISGLIQPQNSIIINFPLLIFSVFGIKEFFYKYRVETILIAITVFPIYIIIFSFGNWAGEFTYGPRYFLFALPILGLPAILVIENIVQLRQKSIKYLFYVIIILGGICSAFINHNVNSLKYFITYDIRYNELSGIEVPYIQKYFDNVHFGLIAYDLIGFRDAGRKLKFLIALENVIPPSDIQRIESHILKKLDPNYYWFGKTEKEI